MKTRQTAWALATTLGLSLYLDNDENEFEHLLNTPPH